MKNLTQMSSQTFAAFRNLNFQFYGERLGIQGLEQIDPKNPPDIFIRRYKNSLSNNSVQMGHRGRAVKGGRVTRGRGLTSKYTGRCKNAIPFYGEYLEARRKQSWGEFPRDASLLI